MSERTEWNRKTKKDIRREEALERAEERAARTDEQQLDLLEARGKTGCKEWRKLMVRTGRELAN